MSKNDIRSEYIAPVLLYFEQIYIDTPLFISRRTKSSKNLNYSSMQKIIDCMYPSSLDSIFKIDRKSFSATIHKNMRLLFRDSAFLKAAFITPAMSM